MEIPLLFCIFPCGDNAQKAKRDKENALWKDDRAKPVENSPKIDNFPHSSQLSLWKTPVENAVFVPRRATLAAD